MAGQETLCALSPEIATSVELAKQFRHMLQDHDASGWLAKGGPPVSASSLRDTVATRRRSRTGCAHLALQHGAGRRSHSSTQANQTSDVRASQTRLAADSRDARVLIKPVSGTGNRHERTAFTKSAEDPF